VNKDGDFVSRCDNTPRIIHNSDFFL